MSLCLTLYSDRCTKLHGSTGQMQSLTKVSAIWDHWDVPIFNLTPTFTLNLAQPLPF